MTTDDGDRGAPAGADEATDRATSAATHRPRGRGEDRPAADDAAPGRRRLLRTLGWVVAFALWSVLCVVWLFPLLTELGLDPTLGG